MTEELLAQLERLEILVGRASKQHRGALQENSQLHGLVTAMESDQKKASKLLNEHEKMLVDRERMRKRIAELLEQFEKLRI